MTDANPVSSCLISTYRPLCKGLRREFVAKKRDHRLPPLAELGVEPSTDCRWGVTSSVTRLKPEVGDQALSSAGEKVSTGLRMFRFRSKATWKKMKATTKAFAPKRINLSQLKW